MAFPFFPLKNIYIYIRIPLGMWRKEWWRVKKWARWWVSQPDRIRWRPSRATDGWAFVYGPGRGTVRRGNVPVECRVSRDTDRARRLTLLKTRDRHALICGPFLQGPGNLNGPTPRRRIILHVLYNNNGLTLVWRSARFLLYTGTVLKDPPSMTTPLETDYLIWPHN